MPTPSPPHPTPPPSATRTEKSTLHLEVKRFAIFIACLAAVTGIVFFVVAITTGSSFAQALVTGLITVLVANVPEGLPATVTTQLTVAADRMRKEHVLVKRMDMIEVRVGMDEEWEWTSECEGMKCSSSLA